MYVNEGFDWSMSLSKHMSMIDMIEISLSQNVCQWSIWLKLVSLKMYVNEGYDWNKSLVKCMSMRDNVEVSLSQNVCQWTITKVGHS